MPLLLILTLLISACSSHKKVTYEITSLSPFSINKVIYLYDKVSLEESQKTFNQNKVAEKSHPLKHIKVGVIEYGLANPRENLHTKRFGKKIEQRFEDHATKVITAFNETQFSATPLIYNCALEDLTFLQDCLQWLEENEVVGINFSIEINVLIGKSYDTLNSLLDSGVIITYAAGNESKMVAGICREYEKIICVGMIPPLNISSISNFGPYVSAWEDGIIRVPEAQRQDLQSYEIAIGTSYASPRYLSKLLKKKYD